jgi:pathogenesis-related protein 1
MSSSTALAVVSLLVMASLSLPSGASAAVAPPRPRGATTAAAFLSAVNDARAMSGVPPLSWNATVAQNAKAQVTWLRASGGCDLGQIDRLPPPKFGGMTFFIAQGRPTPADAVSSWMSERQWYDHGAKTCAAGQVCGDYTLLVQQASRQLGCAVVACASGWALMACEYAA